MNYVHLRFWPYWSVAKSLKGTNLENLNLLLSAFLPKGAQVESVDQRSLILDAIDVDQVVFMTSWVEIAIRAAGRLTGTRRRDLVLANKLYVPLHLGHMFNLLEKRKARMHEWPRAGYITFDGITAKLKDGTSAVPSLHRLETKANWWISWDPLHELAVPAASAVVRVI